MRKRPLAVLTSDRESQNLENYKEYSGECAVSVHVPYESVLFWVVREDHVRK